MKFGVNTVTAVFVAGVVGGLALTPDGRAWLRSPTLMLGGHANASASPPAAETPAAAPAPAQPVVQVQDASGLKAKAGNLRVGVFGDSMGDGVWAALYREFRNDASVEVTKFSEVSTGLSRYDYVNIQAKTQRQLDETPVDVAVVVFGTNDAQGIDEGGTIHDFGTPGWKAAYGRRIDDLVGLFQSRGVVVYWVGMPRMKRDGFDGRMAIVNEVVEARMKALGVPYIETVSLTSDTSGDYMPYAEVGGRRKLMRANDGIHMSMDGYLRLAGPVEAAIRRDAGLAE
ncbi:MAG: DUF459 domain-containing protein [Caulobacteraceae bacterium]|nr:DUF459 domain-containing protein [Caulobacteraceae bacterium]